MRFVNDLILLGEFEGDTGTNEDIVVMKTHGIHDISKKYNERLLR